ncbi:MAG: hypothetical protein WBW53_23985 [Terriglobales bacterium]
MITYAAFLVRAAFTAASFRAWAPRFAALLFAWREMAWWLAADFGFCFNAPETARERVRDFLCDGFFPAAESRSAFFRKEVGPFGGPSFTPARRALERPMATAC